MELRPWRWGQREMTDPVPEQLRGAPGVAGAALQELGDGERATAVVTAVSRSPGSAGTALAPAGAFDLTLEVIRDHGEGFTFRTRLGFSTEERRARVAVAGARLPVVIDPGDQTSLTLDLDALGFS
jgi:hypothetical protein